ncbi:MAG TPA: WGR domain-containing protein, partial [Myxococcales bacterium]|nr:WGR domain-containing protein [Myxococcales bacterium]
MRRFELVDGTSKKFWEIALEGTSFTVRFGRMGTSGQVQQKTFGSADKASAEHDKLVAEKLKKGYAEIGSSAAAAPSKAPAKAAAAAAAPPPAPEPPPAARPAPAPAEDGAPIAWDDAFLRRVHPRRGGVQVPVRPLPTLSKAWSSVRKLFDEIAGPVRAGKARAGALKELTAAVIDRMKGDEPSPAPVGEDAALLTFLEHRASYTHHPNAEPALDLIYLLSGPVHATRAVLKSMEMQLDGKGYREELHLVRELETTWYNGFSNGGQRSSSRLRELLATVATDAEYGSARDAAAELRKPNQHQRPARAYLFPTDRDLLDEAMKKKPGQDDTVSPLLTCAPDASTMRAVAAQMTTYALGRGGWDPLPSLLDGAGRGAVAFFDELKGEIPGGRADARRAWAESLARINSDEAMALLLDVADSKDVVPFATEAIARWPRRAVRLLAARAAARGAGGEAARTLLAPLVRKDPASVEAVLPGLSAEAARAVESLRQGAATVAADAPPERLPAILRSPPWLDARSRALPVLEVADSAPADKMAWRPGERKEWQAKHGFIYDTEMTAAEAERLLKKKGPHAGLFTRLPEQVALKAIGGHGFTEWGDVEWLPALVARFELKILPDMIRAVDSNGVEVLEVLAPYASAALAPRMAEVSARSKTGRPQALAWLLRHPAHAAAGLLAGALGPAGKAKDHACQALRLLAANGQREVVQDAARRTRPPSQEAVLAILDHDPLLQFPERLPKLPAWYDASALPPLTLADRSGKLPAPAVDALVTMLAFPSGDG